MGEAGEGAVGRQDQQDHGGDLCHVVEGPPAENGACQLGDDRLVRLGNDAVVIGQTADPHEEGCQNERHGEHGD